ncbi:MAG: hypothetical protein ACYS0H_17595 [Planctomycetota bacterium]|jgi:hypothetical protein
MRIPRYWARGSHAGVDPRGQEQVFRAWGWSFNSLAGAKEEARARARRIFDALTGGRKPDSYDYLEYPLREEIVDSIGPTGEETAIVTRNRYGALVLNCRAICFADVDFPQVKSTGVLDALFLLFSAQRRRERARELQEASIEKIRAWSERHPERSFRLYRTAAGLRLLFTDQGYDPVSEEVSNLLGELGSDPLYKRLTLKQECFRARLTAKPWRCGCRRPPNRYPWETTDAERRYRAWQKEYEAKSREYVTCCFLETFGGSFSGVPFSDIVNLHDQYTCRSGNAKLA